MSTAVAQLKPKTGLVAKFAQRFDVDESEVKNILKSTAFKVKDGTVTDEQMSALMIISNEYDLNPFTKEIYAYPDKGGIVPVVGVDGWARIINEHPQMDGVEFIYSDEVLTHKGKTCHVWIECVITRKDRAKPTTIREYFDEVVRSVNYTTPWDSHPKRMHRHKALIQCARVAFGFSGIYDEDEAQRIVEIDVTPQGSHEPAAPASKQAAYLTDDEFLANEPAWKKKWLRGSANGLTIDHFKAWVEDQTKKHLTDAMVQTVINWKPEPQATVIEGQATTVPPEHQDFLDCMAQQEATGQK